MIKKTIWVFAIGLLYLGMAGAGTCGKKAKTAIDNAKMAIAQARAADAPTLAPSEFSSAESHLSEAEKLYKKYSFKKSEQEANKSAEYARAALQKAMEEKARLQEQEEENLRRQQEAERANQSQIDTQGLTAEEQGPGVLQDIYFDYDAATISSGEESKLMENASFLLQHPTTRIKLEGNCDERGSNEYNLALGAKRAAAVKDWLVAKGVTADRLETISYGEDLALDKGHDETAWAKNRRVHFAVL